MRWTWPRPVSCARYDFRRCFGRDGPRRQAYQRRARQLSAAERQPKPSNAAILGDLVAQGLTAEQAGFIDHLSTTGNVSDACRLSGLGRVRVIAMRRENAVFAQAWEMALDIATDELELEARRRASDGHPNYLYRNGERMHDNRSNQSVVIVRYSDRLLEFLLKANRPKRFGNLAGTASENPVADVSIGDDPDPPRSERGRRD